MKILLMIFLFLGVSGNDDLNQIKDDLASIKVFYKEYEIKIILDQINSTFKMIDQYERTQESRLLKTIKKSHETILFTHQVVQSIEREKEHAADQYFKLWDKVFYLKKRVDDLYQDKKVLKNYQLNIEKETVILRKKRIFDGYQAIYNGKLEILKKTNECDYRRKIDILNDIERALIKCEKLLYREDTKELEKMIKKAESLEEIENLIMNS